MTINKSKLKYSTQIVRQKGLLFGGIHFRQYRGGYDLLNEIVLSRPHCYYHRLLRRSIHRSGILCGNLLGRRLTKTGCLKLINS